MNSRKRVHYDVETKNLSFIKMHAQLRSQGVSNSKFFLKLYDTDLVGVNPFDDNLTDEMKVKIIQEASVNPWYYLRECVNIPTAGMREGIPFELHVGNLATVFCTLSGIDHYTAFPRQQWQTTTYRVLLHWLFMFGDTNLEFSYKSKNNEAFYWNKYYTVQQVSLLPDYMISLMSCVFDKRDMVVNFLSRNTIRSIPTPKDKEQAEQCGRQAYGVIQFFDDVEHTSFVREIVEASAPVRHDYLENKILTEINPCRIFSTTFGDPLTDDSASFGWDMETDSLRWQNSFYDMTIEDIKSTVATASARDLVSIIPSYQEIGLGEDWFNQMSKILNYDETKIKRELLLQR